MKSIRETTTGPKMTQEVLLEKIVEDSLVGPTISNMSHPATMIEENGRVGALFASKAFVQLIVNPIVGKSTNNWGYEMPFMLGTGLLLVSAISEFIKPLLILIESYTVKKGG